MDRSERSLSTSGKAEFIVDHPPGSKQLKPQKGCICLDKLVDEERERHAKNIAFQKALIKRLEASEKRLTYDNWDEDDDDDDDEGGSRRRGGGGRRRGRSRRTEEREPTPVATPPPPQAPSVKLNLPTVKRVYDDDRCLCYKKIRKEERKRKRFVSRLEKEQEKYERKNLKAQMKYEKRRIKAYKKCEKLQNIIDTQYNKGDKTVKISQGDEMYSVYLHMDPGDCGCNPRERFIAKFRKYLFKFCVCFYFWGFLIGAAVYYVYTQF